jgi:hypothetical protein
VLYRLSIDRLRFVLSPSKGTKALIFLLCIYRALFSKYIFLDLIFFIVFFPICVGSIAISFLISNFLIIVASNEASVPFPAEITINDFL